MAFHEPDWMSTRARMLGEEALPWEQPPPLVTA
jgi:hypothetical protein